MRATTARNIQGRSDDQDDETKKVLNHPRGPTRQSLRACHYLTIKVTGIVTGCTLELELVTVIVIV
jgi:hypothetical protein